MERGCGTLKLCLQKPRKMAPYSVKPGWGKYQQHAVRDLQPGPVRRSALLVSGSYLHMVAERGPAIKRLPALRVLGKAVSDRLAGAVGCGAGPSGLEMKEQAASGW